MLKMAMRYTGHVVKTRTAATGLALTAYASLLPFVAMRGNLSRPWQTGTLVILTLMPLMVAYRCLNFLAKLERQHDTPTPEMSFIFGLAVSLPMARQSIDLIAMLQEKTRGNLSGDEERTLSQALYDLRMRYVEVTKSR